jgi:DNA-binding FadR family transcriptional regulator
MDIVPCRQAASVRLSIDEMTRLLRERICSTAPDVEMVLYETELSREFSVSRTPIRQVLQRLAYEQLVRTVSGVGTVVVPMLREDRPIHMQTHQSLLRLIESQERTQPVYHDDAGVLRQTRDYLRMRGLLAERVTAAVTDPILEASVAAALWREVRWAVHDVETTAEVSDQKLGQIIEHWWGHPVRCVYELTQWHAERVT